MKKKNMNVNKKIMMMMDSRETPEGRQKLWQTQDANFFIKKKKIN